jgi:outer membrane receptor protein involved in Fe transport
VNRIVFAFLFCLTVLCCSAIPAQEISENSGTAQPKEKIRATHLDQVVRVTADGVRATLLDTPSTINIITADDIEQSGQRDLTGIITSIPGVLDDGSGATYFNFRGTRSSSSEGAAIFIDGKPLNLGKMDYSIIDDIPRDIVERIEVVKSPAASRYGANSSRGAINIVTRSGQNAGKPFDTRISLDIGSWQSYKAFVTMSGKKNSWDYSAQFGRDQSEGYRQIDSERTLFNAKAGYEIASGIRIDANFGWNDTWRKNARGLQYWSLDEYRDRSYVPNSQTGSTYNVRPNESDHRLFSSGIAFQYNRGNWNVNTSFDFSHFDDIFSSLRYYNNPGNGTTQRGQGTYIEDRNENKYGFKATANRSFIRGEHLLNTFSIGYDYALTDWDQARDYPYAESLSSSTITAIKKNDLDFSRAIHGVFINNDLKWNRWGLYLGMRHDSVIYSLENRLPLSVEKTFSEPSWDVIPSFSIGKNSNLYFSIGRNYWYPNSYYLIAAMEYDDPDNQPEDLKPEKYLNFEIGLKQQVHASFNYSVALYRSNVDNKYMPFYTSGGFKGYKHVGKSIHQGIELEADGHPLHWLGYRAGFTYINAKWDDATMRIYVYGATPSLDTVQSVDISGKRVYRVPAYQYTGSLIFTPLKPFTFSVDIHGFGKQNIDAYNRYKQNAVNLVDLKAGYRINKFLELYILGSNVFNTHYESIFNTDGKRTKDGIPNHDYYPKDGRYVQGGIKVRF